MRDITTIVSASGGLLALGSSVLLCVQTPDRTVVVGPFWTPHLAAAGAIVGAVLLVVALVSGLSRPRSGAGRAWSTLLADGASALGVIGLVCWTVLVVAGLALWTAGDRVGPVTWSGERYVEEQDALFSAHGWARDGVRHGLVVTWGPWYRTDRR
jgi:hypothetical protein